MIESICCSSRGPELDFWHPYQGIQNIQRPLLESVGIVHAVHSHMHRHAQTHIIWVLFWFFFFNIKGNRWGLVGKCQVFGFE